MTAPLSGIVHAFRCDRPAEYGSYTTAYNGLTRRPRKDIWQSIYAALTGDRRTHRLLLADSTHIKAHRSAAGAEKRRSNVRRLIAPPRRSND